MNFRNKVLIVDDNIGAISWLIDFVEWRGYEVDYVGNEEATRAKLNAVQEGRIEYALAILDIMISTKDVMDIVDLDDEFYEASMDSGIRLCRYAREELGLTAERLPIICLSARDDDELKQALGELGIELFGRSSLEIREFLRKNLPELH